MTARTTSMILKGHAVHTNKPPADGEAPLVRLRGTSKGAPAAFALSEKTLSMHTLLVGGTGSGKTNLFYHIVDQLQKRITADDVIILFDSKGDFYARFFRPGDVVIGNSSAYRSKSERWSLYEEITADGHDKQSVTQNAHEVARALFAKHTDGNTSNPFFPNAARDLFASILIALIREGVSFSNRDLSDYLSATPVEEIRRLLGAHRDLAAVVSYIGGKSGSQAQGVLSELYAATREILMGVFADVGGFSMRSFVRKKGGKTLFIEYDLSIGDSLGPIYSLLFDLALKEAMGRTAAKGNVYLIADELRLLPNLRHLEDGVNFGRSLGVKVLAGLQSIDQLAASYPNPQQAQNIISGFSSIYAFHCAHPGTREHVSRLFGTNVMLEHHPGADGTYREDKREGYCVEDWDLLSLGVGEAVVGLPFQPPFFFQFELYK